MDAILALAKMEDLIILAVVVLLAAAALMVPLSFFWGWLSVRPEVGLGSLGTSSRSKLPRKQWAKARFTPLAEERQANGGRKCRPMKARFLRIQPGLAEDLFAFGGGPVVNGHFVALEGRLCAFDNGLRVFYRHKDMLKNALWARVGRVYWLPAVALPVLLILVIVRHLAVKPDSFILFPQLPWLDSTLTLAAVFVFYALLSIILWRSLAWLRANAIIRRVEKCLADLDIMRNRRTPPLEKNPLKYTGLAAVMFLLAVAGGIVFWLQYVAPVLGWLPGLLPLW